MEHRFSVGELSASVRPQDDLWGWVNDEWLASDPIPADRSRYGLSDWKRAQVAEQLREVVTGASAQDGDPAQKLLAHLLALAADSAARARAGVSPLDAELALIETATTPERVLAVWGEVQRAGVVGPFSIHPQPREDDASRWQVSLFQAGTTLPVPPLYARLGEELTGHAHRLAEIAGWSPGLVDRALAVGGDLAACAWDEPEGARDEDLHHPMTWEAFAELLGVDPAGYLDAVGVTRSARSDAVLNVCQPSYAAGLGELLRSRPVADWQDFLRWRVLQDRAPLLSPAVADEHARFHQCVLGGQPEPAPLWRRQVDLVQGAAPWALAQAWVGARLDPQVQRRTTALAERLREQLRHSLVDCPWLGEQSTRAAVAKLDAVVLAVGWPQRWPSPPQVDPSAGLVAAVTACASAEHDRAVGVLAGPVDRGRWGPPPFVVNTFYDPFLNQVTVEGASLPPVEVLDDLPVLMGQYASIIGHELGHAFDSRGSTRDADGRLRPWWTEQERAEFERRVRQVEGQVDGYRPRGVDDAELDGARVGFECVAELIGVQLAWDAWCALASPQERSRTIGGLTQDQRFFAAKAYGRRSADRPATARARLLGDVHPPFEVFTNLVRNLDAFHETFGTASGDGMWLAPEDRVRFF